ncbi:polysaccharide deacetylase family protein [Raineyella sp. LH-20]|uniref:polysaccharide deacetylase family protein n=1 Tax=Raineyella sp. LH-20 TaxID=3081204 RepID=UPI002952CF62|nr:polysaccharide deacetylase family protein [Raineyella sp. LH-20]WOP17229.1 polysaccharide deacetylase family protein [Raineyella sp. LH-20]
MRCLSRRRVSRRAGAFLAAALLGTVLGLGGGIARGAPPTSAPAPLEPTATASPSPVDAATPAPSSPAAAAPTSAATTTAPPAGPSPAVTGPSASSPPATAQAAPSPSATTSTPPPSGAAAIAAKAAADASVVGDAVSPVRCDLVRGGCLQTYQYATIYWSSTTGAHWVRGGILKKWGTLAWEGGILGYPLTDEICGLGSGGCRTDFENGTIAWSPTTDAHWMKVETQTAWDGARGADGFLGFPTSDEYCGLIQSGCGSHFEGGLIYWSSATGAHWIRGAISAAWGRAQWEGGPLGYPLTDEICGLGRGGCRQTFQGATMYWSPPTDAHWVRGAIRAKWESIGGEDGFLGYPTSDEYCGLAQGGCGHHFEGGLIYWSPSTDAHWILGEISKEWGRNAWEGGRYGYPTSDEMCRTGSGGGTLCRQTFQGGLIKWRNDLGIIDCGRLKCIGMTFDDGPSQYTSRLVDILDANNVNATFFVVGQNVVNFAATTQRSFANGNEIMNHSWDHPDLVTLGPSDIASELSRTSDAIESIVGVRPVLMRPPYGSYNSTVTSLAGHQGMAVVLWNVETSDWDVQVTAKVIDNATSRAQPGGLILMHDLYPTTVDAVPSIITTLKAKGYALVTASDVLGSTAPGQVYVGRP